MDRFYEEFFKGNKIDVLLDDFGNYLFSGEDVAYILGFPRSWEMYGTHLDHRDKFILREILINGTTSGTDYCTKDANSMFITEAGLYKILLGVRKKTLRDETKAQKIKREKLVDDFKEFVFYNLLPKLRKTGIYATTMAVAIIANNQSQTGVSGITGVPTKDVNKTVTLSANEYMNLMNELYILRNKKKFEFVAPSFAYLKILTMLTKYGKPIDATKFGQTELLNGRASSYRGADPTSRMDIYFPLYKISGLKVEMQIRRMFSNKLLKDSLEIIVEVDILDIAFCMYNIIRDLYLINNILDPVRIVFFGPLKVIIERRQKFLELMKEQQTNIVIELEDEDDSSDDTPFDEDEFEWERELRELAEYSEMVEKEKALEK